MGAFSDAVSESIRLIENNGSSLDYEPLDCEGTVGYYAFLAYLLIPSILCVLAFCFTVKRKFLWQDRLYGRPGMAYPMNMLTRNQSIPFAACFGVIAPLIFKIVFESKEAIDYDGPHWGRPFVTILSVIIYGTNCFPMFAAVSLKQPFSYCLGSLYTWAFTALLFVEHSVCSMSLAARITYSLQSTLQFACIAYLDVFLPYHFVQAVRRRLKTGTWDRPEDSHSWKKISRFYHCRRVTTLLRPQVEEEKVEQSCCMKIKTFFQDWTYKWDKDFRYSSRIICILWISFMILFMTFIKAVWSFSKLLRTVNSAVSETLNAIGWDDQASDSDLRKDARSLLRVYYHATRPLWLLLMFCLFVAFVIGVISILYILTSYRANLRALYRGDHSHLSPREVIGNIDIVTGSLRYAGYQVGYIIWAFVIQAFCFLVAIIIVVGGIAVLIEGFSSWLVTTIQYLIPWLGLFLIILLLQHLAAKHAFLEDHTQSVSIDNRRALFTVNYFMFFYNVFVSIGSCLWRLGKSMGLGILLISRLDHSLLPRKFELGDTGFSRYSGFMHLECYHTHPCMQTFVLILVQCRRDTYNKLLGSTQASSGCLGGKQTTGQFLLTAVMGLFGAHRLTRSDQPSAPKRNKVSSVPAKEDGKTGGDDIRIKPILRENTWDLGKSKTHELIAKNNENTQVPAPLPSDDAMIELTNKDDKILEVHNMSSSSAAEYSTVELQEEGEETDPCVHLRESESLKQHRRKQKAAFAWFLLYTLLYNPQLSIERKQFLQRKRCFKAKSLGPEENRDAKPEEGEANLVNGTENSLKKRRL